MNFRSRSAERGDSKFLLYLPAMVAVHAASLLITKIQAIMETFLPHGIGSGHPLRLCWIGEEVNLEETILTIGAV